MVPNEMQLRIFLYGDKIGGTFISHSPLPKGGISGTDYLAGSHDIHAEKLQGRPQGQGEAAPCCTCVKLVEAGMGDVATATAIARVRYEAVICNGTCHYLKQFFFVGFDNCAASLTL